MPATDSPHSPEELARLGTEIFDRKVRPTLRPEDDGKFIAIDILSGDFEIHEDDYTAVMQLRARRPSADMWLMRVGMPATCRIGRSQ